MNKKLIKSASIFAVTGMLWVTNIDFVEACTSVLVGKDASEDGSTMIARNEDMGTAWAKHFYVR